MTRLWVLMAVCFVDMMGLMIVGPLMPFYALRLEARDWMVGPLLSAFAVAQLVSSPYWGRLSDRYGRRPALMVGLGTAAVAYAVFGFATALWVLFAARLVQGLGGGTTAVAQAYVADTMAPGERAKALGWLSAATNLGVVIGPLLGSLAYAWGPAAPGVAAAAIVLLNVGFAWKWLPESRDAHHAADSARPRRSVRQALVEIVRHPGRPAHRVIWIYVVGMLALNVVIGTLALYLKHTFGVTAETVGTYFVIFGIVNVAMRALLVGWVNAQLGEVRTMQLGALLLMLGLVLMPFPRTPAAFVLAMALVPIGTALLFPASTSLVSQRTERAELGLVMGAQQTFRGIMAIIGPIGATVIFDTLGHGVPFLVAAGTVAVAVLLAAREPRHLPAPATFGA
jgi:multidrug resistance protein